MIRYLKIREFADMIGVSTTTVRKYEEEGKLLPHHRTMSNQRLYTMGQVEAFINGDFESPLLRGTR